MGKFITENWRLILEIALVCCSAVVFMLRKKPVKVVDTLKEIIVRALPALICQAEKIYLNCASDPDVKFTGFDKLKFVLDSLAKFLKELNYGDDVIAQYLPFASEMVELILSTPQKKSGRKE